MGKKQLSMKAINEILSRIDPDKRTTAFHKDHIEKLYREYQMVDVNDEADFCELKAALSGSEILLIAPGSSINDNQESIKAYIAERSPVVISANHVPSAVKADYVFISNNLRYGRMLHALRKACSEGSRVIVTSNIMPEEGACDFRISYPRLTADEAAEGNSMLLLITMLRLMGTERAAVAGFDGFTGNESANYSDSYLRFDTDTHTGGENRAIAEAIVRTGMQLDFLTPSLYKEFLQ